MRDTPLPQAADAAAVVTPKAFISYSWTSLAHQSTVKQWAERLLADGVNVVMDIFDLKEGHDKYAFMEQMVTDPTVTHVLVMCDKAYAEKADARKAGVGTERRSFRKRSTTRSISRSLFQSHANLTRTATGICRHF